MLTFIKEIGCGMLYHTGLSRLPRFNTRILTYHKANPKYFEAQIAYLAKNYKTVALRDIFTEQGNAVVVTFDDGYVNNLQHAYPILKKYNVPATIFVGYNFIENNEFAWWDRLEHTGKKYDINKLKRLDQDAMEKEVFNITGLKKESKKPKEDDFMSWRDINKISDVFEIGSHTISHPILTNIKIEEAKREIFFSRKKISDKIGRNVISFAYPNGSCNTQLAQLVRQAGYKFAVHMQNGNNNPDSNRFMLNRRGVNIKDSLSIFAAKVAGLF